MLIALYSTSVLLVDRGYGGFVEGIFVEIKQYDHDRIFELLELIATTVATRNGLLTCVARVCCRPAQHASSMR